MVGHTLGSPDPFPLSDAFFNPFFVVENGICPLITGLVEQPAQRVDVFIVDELRNLLFANLGFDFDLASINIQRSRDHGLPGTRKKFDISHSKVTLTLWHNLDGPSMAWKTSRRILPSQES